MMRFQLCALQKDRKSILERLQVRGVTETKDSEAQDPLFFKADTRKQYTDFLKSAETAARAVGILDAAHARPKSMFAALQGRKVVSPSEWEAIARQSDEMIHAAERIVELDKDIQATKTEITLCETQEAVLELWLDLPVPENYTGSPKTAAFIGSLPNERSVEDLQAALSGWLSEDAVQRAHLQIISKSPEQTNFFILCLKQDESVMEEALRQMGFTKPAVPEDAIPPAARREQMQSKRMSLHASMAENQKEIQELSSLAESLEQLEDYLTARANKYQVIEQMTQSSHTFILEGYVLERDAAALKKELEGAYMLAFEVSDGDDDAPVYLQNGDFVQAISGVLESYSLPGPGEIDPLPVMSVFYYLTFGLMFSDAAYGLVLAGVCAWLLRKFKNMEQGMKNFLQMFFWCGISTIIWGVVFSSYFGDVVNVVSRTFFGHEVGIPPLWFAPLEKPMLMLVFCLGVGVLHLTFAYGMKAWSHIRRGRGIEALYDAVFPVGLIYPLIVVLMGGGIFETMAGFKLDLSAAASQTCMAISGVCMLGIVLTGGRESQNWGVRILQGVYALYNQLAGWLSDILSYSRLLGLGLAAGVIASVMNSLGSMGGGGPIGILLFIIVFLLGQSLNFAINVLGSYVHSNRLEYVEFFGKFYEGGGRKFTPFGVNTKHIKPTLE
jgi:V/A-type H+-transporting ATPase subunit I